MALNSGITNKTSRPSAYQILTNDDEVCIPSLSSILLAVLGFRNMQEKLENSYSYMVA